MRNVKWMAMVMVFIGMSFVGAKAQEHPTGAEHPTGTEATEEHPTEKETGQEHPTDEDAAEEHPDEKTQAAEHGTLTKDELADSIANYIRKESQLKGGFFLFYDKKTEKILKLKLDHVHRERVAHTGDNVYFACSDFVKQNKPNKGKVYDLDFWMKRDQKGNLNVTKVMVHKAAGQPRFKWYEQDDIWKRKPVGGAEKKGSKKKGSTRKGSGRK